MSPADRVTLVQIAHDMGVSRATVSNAYNHPEQLSSALRERILARAGELGFAGPDPTARSLRRGAVGAIGVVVDQGLSYAFSDPATVLMLDGLAGQIQPAGLGLLIHTAAGDRTEQAAELAYIRDAAVDAWVLLSLPDDSPAIEAVRARRRPVVVLDQPLTADFPLVAVDDLGGTALLTRHLTRLGHRRIAVLSMPLGLDRREGVVDIARQATTGYRNIRQRLAGVSMAASEAGIGWSTVAVMECASNDPDAGASGTLALLALQPAPTAIIALSDQLALGALRAAQDTDLHVPDQLSVVGFDDSPSAAHGQPPLTTVRQPLRERGEAAGRVVLAVLAGQTPEVPGPFDVQLVVRASTAPPY